MRAGRLDLTTDADVHSMTDPNRPSEGRPAMQQLNITDPLVVDEALAPNLEALELAVRDHRSI
ncbi:hypothetical protein [Subtercola boreus]|uniref:Uncharacterized protein n=1 Tax=Subtercola boreus TaxID=120213 RepID=A0A3E0W9M6_9MICO|nr:hypothetical protein [Subtercola boreus]RFA20540.1 hypothetical protein B7R24_08895 [Subtercola boreus]RFA20655.1 hypothetical protein B7R23_08830 [Subtercola boreus]RFA26865.1 hypothetical protein B7R25_08960 [Subtercola boreus]